MYKVFINDRALIIGKKRDFKDIKNKHLINPNKKEIKNLLEAFHSHLIKETYLILTNNIKSTWEIICSFYAIIQAAGGLVYNNERKILLIFRNNKWDLPKGKIKKKENILKAAKREVIEECGVKKLKIEKALPNTYHYYSDKNKKILKEVFWFEMSCKYTGKLTPQEEEGIKEVRWVKKEKCKKLIKNSYPSIQDLFNKI